MLALQFHSFLGSAITNYQREAWWLVRAVTYSFTLLKDRSQVKAPGGSLHSEVCRKRSFSAFAALGAPLGPSFVATYHNSLCKWLSFLCPCANIPFLSLTIPTIGFRAHSKSRMISYQDLKKKVLFIYLFERQCQRGRWRDRSSTCWLIPLLAVVARAGSFWSMQAPKHWTILSSRH